MEKDEKDVNNFIIECFADNYCENKLLFNNLSIIQILFINLELWLTDFFNEFKCEINWHKIAKADFCKKEQIINDFFKYLNIDFNMQKIINDGTLNVSTYSFEQALNNHEYFFSGQCGMNYEKHYINVNNNDLLTDAIVWVHEITHFRNDFNTIRSEVNDLLTESISFTYELILLKYLAQIGYTYESKAFYYSVFYSLFYHTYSSYYPLQLLNLYNQFGEINEKNYNLLYNNINNYNLCIQEFKRLFINEKNNIMFYIQYGIANALSFYMYKEYIKDKSFIKKIEKLNSSLEILSLEECLNIIGIINYNDVGLRDYQNLKKIKDAIETIKYSLMIDNSLIRFKQKTL